MADMENSDSRKPHRVSHSGRKAEKKKAKNQHVQEFTPKQRNPKAFAIQSATKAERRFRRTMDIRSKSYHVPTVDRTPLKPPPAVVAIVGPPKVGKTTLMQCLIRNFTKQKMSSIKGPVTLVSGKKKRLTLIECNNDINCMMDVAKIADLVLLLIDASSGFEMETFEFLNICQVHGMPRIMGVLTHLDLFKNKKTLQKTKTILKKRYRIEIPRGEKMFYFSGMLHGEYLKNEVHNLGRFISVIKFQPSSWKLSHPYVLADRMEEITNPERLAKDATCNRVVCLYGYARGGALKRNSYFHIPGAGDYFVKNIHFLPDPCPLPEKKKKRSLNEKERLIYAPMSGVGGIVYDKDAVYIEFKGNQAKTQVSEESEKPSEKLLNAFISTHSFNKVHFGKMPLLASSAELSSENDSDSVIEDNESNLTEKMYDYGYDEESENSDESEEKSDDEDGTSEKQTSLKHGTEPPKKKFKTGNQESTEKLRNNFTTKKSVGKLYSSEMSLFSSSKTDKTSVEKDTLDNEDIFKSDESDSDIDNDGFLNDEKLPDSSESEEDYDDNEVLNSETEDTNIVKSKKKVRFEDEIDDNASSIQSDNVKSKNEVFEEAADAFYKRQEESLNFQLLVYGKKKKKIQEKNCQKDEVGGLFHITSHKKEKQNSHGESVLDKKLIIEPKNWISGDEIDIIKDRFVTGKWDDSEDAQHLLDQDDELYGDFEDYEKGPSKQKENEQMPEDEKMQEDKDGEANVDKGGDANIDKEKKEKTLQEKRMEKKRKLKELFDSEFDDKEQRSYHDDLKMEVTEQGELNRKEFENIDDEIRVQFEGYRPGLYVRIEIEEVPCEFVNNFDPTYPVIAGSLKTDENKMGYMQVRLKKHRWYPRILKSRDPLILSLGWKRFQTIPLYYITDHNGRNRLLKYTPKHLHCMAAFWGPITALKSGFVALQSVSEITNNFRIAAIGAVTEVAQTTNIVKKLKLIGAPLKIERKTAFIKDMFHSPLEVAKYEGAAIRTVSGIRGQIKKAVRKPLGVFRATFEDKILLSDIVFLRTWVKVEVPQFCTSVYTLLLPSDQKMKWQGMKTLGRLRYERGLHAPVSEDSKYIPIERKLKQFADLVIPKSIQKGLPFKDKVKHFPKKTVNSETERIAVIREPHEREIAKVLTMLKAVHKLKCRKEDRAMWLRARAHKKQKRKEEAEHYKKLQQKKKRILRHKPAKKIE